jgi:RNA polymerase primary sigma factor
VVTSLDRPIGEGDENALGDILARDESADPEEEVVVGLREERLKRALGALSERQREVIELRYGLTEEGDLSLEEIGGRLGLSRERARQLEAEALARLAAKSELRELSEAA